MQASAQHLQAYGDEDKYGTKILVRIRLSSFVKIFLYDNLLEMMYLRNQLQYRNCNIIMKK